MTRPSFAIRTALTVYTLPFLIGGILLAGVAYSWLYESLGGDWRLLLFPLFAILANTGIVLGGLVAYGILVLAFLWIAPNSPLIAQADEQARGQGMRLLVPAFTAVRKIAESLAPSRR